MKEVWTRLSKAIRSGGHQIVSGRYPLYRLVMLGYFVGSLVQLFMGAPPSVANTTDISVQHFYLLAQLLGSVLILISIQFLQDTARAARIERIGLLWLLSAILIHVGSVCVNNSGLPKTAQIYVIAGIGVYCSYRLWEINKNLRTLGRVVKIYNENGAENA